MYVCMSVCMYESIYTHTHACTKTHSDTVLKLKGVHKSAALAPLFCALPTLLFAAPAV